MLNRVLICMVMLAVVFGCANQQKETAEEPAEQTQEAETTKQAPEAVVTEQVQETETTEQVQEAEVAVEEISLTVNGMT